MTTTALPWSWDTSAYFSLTCFIAGCLSYFFVSLLSNLSVPLLSGCDVASAEGVYTHVAQNSRLMQTSGDKSKYEHFIKIPLWSLNLESPKSASRERSQPILEQHALCFGFDHFSQCNHRHWGGGLDSRVYWKDISSSLLTQWRGKKAKQRTAGE